MFSCSSITDSSKRKYADSKSAGKLTLVFSVPFVQRSQFKNLLVRYLQVPMIYSLVHSEFLRCIASVVLVVSKKKMFGVDTGRIVAFMKNAQSRWNWSIVKNPRCPMGFDESPSLSPLPDYTVSVFVCSTNPYPTIAGRLDLSPESKWERFGKSLRSKVLGCNLNHLSSVCADWVTGPSALLFSHKAIE